MVDNVPGGTDVYFERVVSDVAELWEEEFERPKAKDLEPLISECIGVGHYWWFRRSAGQPAIICLAYGLIAGSLAAITNGFIYSGDSAWDYERRPAKPEEFLGFYFRPALALDERFKSWSERCQLGLRAELQAGTASR